MTRLYKLEKEALVDQLNAEKTTFEEYINNIKVEIKEYKDNYLEVDIINIDCSIANAIRRILINEIPTMAVDKVILKENDTVFPDEFLAHRLGQTPVFANPDLFDFPEDLYDASNSIKFLLHVENQSTEIKNIYSDDISWVPQGDQANKHGVYSFKKGVLLFKLAPRHKISAELIVTKNIGKNHAKWSPVAPASYRLMPCIEINDFYDEEAIKLQSCFSKGVIELKKEGDRMKAFVANPRLDNMSREALRHPEFENRVFIGRKANHFIFTIETVFLDPVDLLKKSLHVLIGKCQNLKNELNDD